MVFLGVEPRSVGVVLADGICDVGGITSAQVPRDGEPAVPLCNLCPLICLTPEEKHGKSQTVQLISKFYIPLWGILLSRTTPYHPAANGLWNASIGR
jgi:hypothetical protein